ncbi:hypothetical protein GCM10010279_26220 [Streptomyces mutabilis]|nr:hypothetical protein GCM10010279_26220 [Streptomyces mutabilis]
MPTSETAAANSRNTLMRSIGTSLAGALAGVVPAQMTISLGGFALPSENAFKVVMGIGAGAALLAFVIASVIPRHRPAAGAAHPAPAGDVDARAASVR